jgi:FkbM family methyltransferase
MKLGNIVTGIYSLAHRLRLTELSIVKPIFRAAYFFYKSYEDPLVLLVRRCPHLFEHGHLLDVGANIGYTAMVLAKGARKPFKVFAFEPEPQNFLQLTDNVKRYRLQEDVIPLNYAVGSERGAVKLWLNEDHHADHRVLTPHFQETLPQDRSTFSVEMTSLDDFAESKGVSASIAFIKIDVQGYELPVCYGMKEILQQSPEIVVCVEFEPTKMADLGFSADDLLRFFAEQGFFLYRLDHKGVLSAIDVDAVRALIPTMKSYFYLLFSKTRLSLAV